MTHLEQLLQVGVLTGSRAFHCATTESDWDIAILESDCERLMNGDIINDTDFKNLEYEPNPSEGKPGFNLSEYPEFEEEPFIEYNEHTIWGPLARIVKYYAPDSEEIINLFVYEDTHADILPKFIELNELMTFLYGCEIANKQKRIEAFKKVIKHVGITDF